MSQATEITKPGSNNPLNTDKIPLDMLKNIALELPFDDLQSYCLTNKQFARVCRDPNFWRMKLYKDYAKAVPAGKNPREFYKNYSQSGYLYTFGENRFGQLGDATTNNSNVPIFIAANIIKVACGGFHTAIITVDNKLYIFGSIEYYHSDILSNVKDVACGGRHTAIILENGDLYTLGRNHFGQLGTGDFNDRLEPTYILSNVKTVSCGDQHTAIILENGDLYAFGDNEHGELGTGYNFIQKIFLPIRRNSTTYIRSGVKAVACGRSYTAIILENGDLYTFGANEHGQLGDGTNSEKFKQTYILSNVKAVACGGSHTAIILENGDLYTFGFNIFGQLGTVTALNNINVPLSISSNIKAVACGTHHTAIITLNGDLYTFGANSYGQLGDATRNSSNIPIGIASDVKAVSCGNSHTAIIVQPAT